MHAPHFALVIASLKGGGAERVMSDLASRWALRGHEISLITLNDPMSADSYALNPDVRRVRLGSPGGGSSVLAETLRRIFDLRRTLRELKPDGVISFIDATNVATILATRGLDIPIAVCERTDPAVNPTISSTWRRLRKYTYRFANHVVAQTGPAAEWLSKECSVKAVVVPNPIRITPPAPEARVPLIVAAGRLDPHKRFDLVLRAFAAAAQRFPEWRLAILGEGPEKASLLELRARLDVVNTVELPGRVGDVEDWFARAAIVVHASRFEGFPNVVLEAMAMGAAVVATNCRSGPAELIQDGVNGRLTPVDDLDALTAALTQLLGDSDARRRLGSQAILVRQRYAIDRIIDLWNVLFRYQPANSPGDSNTGEGDQQ